MGLVVRVTLPSRCTVVEDSGDRRKGHTVLQTDTTKNSGVQVFFKKDLSIYYEYVCFAYMSMYLVCAVPMEAGDQCQGLWIMTYRWLWATV